MEEQIMARQMLEQIAANCRVTDRQFAAIESRLRGATFPQIGVDLGVSPERAKHIYTEGIRRCRKAAIRLGLLKRRGGSN
jgi:hypothetical protein